MNNSLTLSSDLTIESLIEDFGFMPCTSITLFGDNFVGDGALVASHYTEEGTHYRISFNRFDKPKDVKSCIEVDLIKEEVFPMAKFYNNENAIDLFISLLRHLPIDNRVQSNK